MNTKKCKYCGESIPSSANKCRFCGNSFGMPTWLKILLTLFGVVTALVLIIIIACFLICFFCVVVLPVLLAALVIFAAISEGHTNNTYTENTKNYYIGETYTVSNIEATFKSAVKDYSIVLDDPDLEVIKYTITFKNANKTTTNNLKVTNTQFRCYSDSALVNKYLGPSNKYSNSYSISSGDSVDIDIYCKVPKNSTNNKLRYRGADFKKN